MPEATHEILGGKVQLFRRPNSDRWQCRASVGGRQHQHSTKQASLAQAKDVAEDWFLTLKGKATRGEVMGGKTFRYAAERFLDEFEVVTAGERNPHYVDNHRSRMRLHLMPFFGDKPLAAITSGVVQAYRYHRIKTNIDHRTRHDSGDGPPATRPLARSTLHQEIVVLRQVLKMANRNGWLTHLPDLSPPYRSSGKVSHRAWFSPAEYKRLYAATRERAKNPKKDRWRDQSESLHDLVLFMVNTGLRPDELLRLQFRDVEVVTEEVTGERILHIEVRGKVGVGYCKSMPGAVLPFSRVKKRRGGAPTDVLFPSLHRQLFNTILTELDLKQDREGQRRTAYSLRHTYICLRLMEGADIYQIAKNCRTSVEMIETFYASHIKNTLDAAAINVRKAKAPRRKALEAA